MVERGKKIISFGPKEYVVPGDWKVNSIEETSTLKGRIGWQGLTTKEYLDDGEYYLVTGTDFKEGRIAWETCHYVEKDRFDQDRNIQLKKNDLLITKDGTIGKVAIVDKDLDKPATLNSGVFVLRPSNGQYEEWYMYHYLISNFFTSFISQIKAGSTIAHLYQRDFNKFQFLLPPLPEQKKIASILSTVDDAIQNVKAQIDRTKALKKGLMQKLFSEGIGKKQGWKKTSLGSILSCKPSYGANAGAIPYEEDITYRYIRITDIDSSGNLIESNKVGILKEEGEDYILEEDDIIIARTGNTVGKSYKHSLKNNGLCTYAGYLIKFKVDQSLYNVDFLFQYLHSARYYNWVKNESRIGAQPNINAQIYQSLKLPLPPLPEQRKIASILSTVDEKISQLKQDLEGQTQLKKGLMQKLLTGEVRVKVDE